MEGNGCVLRGSRWLPPFHGFFSLPNGCTIFALGISGVITFEEDIQAYSEQRCRVVSVDSVRFLDDKVE